MAQVDHGKLIKLLMLTTSDADGEALNAIRAANNVLKKARVNWEEVFQGKTKVDPFDDFMRKHNESWRRQKDREKDEIEEMFSACMDKVQGSAREFICSLHDQWEARGSLSPKQLSALRKFYSNLR